MHIKWRPLLISLGVPLLVGGISALLTRSEMESFSHLNQPPLSPPAWLFPVVWTILYLLMGLASYLVWDAGENSPPSRRALTLYGVQLAMNFLWSIVFFNLKWYLFAFLWLMALWVVIIVTMVKFFPIRRSAGWMLLPYVLWVTFAAYLNFGIYLLN